MSGAMKQDQSGEFRHHWPIVLGCFIGVTFGIASVFAYTVGIFMKPLQAEFGWSRSAISLGLLLSTLTTALTSPLMGYIADRVNLRRIVILSTLGLAFSFLLFASLWNALWFFMVLMVGKSFLSAGTSPVIYTRVVNQWFDKSRGLALGLVLAGNGVAGALFPRFLAPYVAEHGWRAGYLAIAGLVMVTAPLVWLLVKDRRVHGGAEERARRLSAEAGSVDTRTAMRSPIFWLLAFTLFLPSLGIGGIAIHIIPLLSDAGLSPARAGAIAGLLGVAVIIGRISTGWLIDRFFAPYVAAIVFALTALGCLGLAIYGVGFAPYAAFLVGIATGAEVDIIGFLVARYFGMKSYGLIYGLMYTIFVFGASVSQMIASMIFDRMGYYDPYLYFATASLLAGSLVATRLPRFKPGHGHD